MMLLVLFRYNRFERDKVVSFVPPDGHFELMRYRPNISGRTIVPPLFCQVCAQSTSAMVPPPPPLTSISIGFQPQVSMESGGGHQAHVSVTIGVRSDTSLVIPNRTMGSPLVVEDVVVHIPFSKSVRTVNLVATAGTVLYDEVTKIAKWTVGKFGLDKRPQVSGTVLRHTPGSGPGNSSGVNHNLLTRSSFFCANIFYCSGYSFIQEIFQSTLLLARRRAACSRWRSNGSCPPRRCPGWPSARCSSTTSPTSRTRE